MTYTASVLVANSKPAVPELLNPAIVAVCKAALESRGTFTIALSGGSLPGFLSSLPDWFSKAGFEPQWDCWHVLLADERCVPVTNPDSNLGSLNAKLFESVPVPPSQIYGINEEKLSDSADAVAQDYEPVVRTVLSKSGGLLDLAVLGFGPDGHTCSLFPGHALLQEMSKWVAPIEDSPKPPPKRITLTYPVLNSQTRHVIFCGAGGSKSPILQEVFASVVKKDDSLTATIAEPAPFPCAGVLPKGKSEEESSSLTWVVDKDAMEGVKVDD